MIIFICQGNEIEDGLDDRYYWQFSSVSSRLAEEIDAPESVWLATSPHLTAHELAGVLADHLDIYFSEDLSGLETLTDTSGKLLLRTSDLYASLIAEGKEYDVAIVIADRRIIRRLIKYAADAHGLDTHGTVPMRDPGDTLILDLREYEVRQICTEIPILAEGAVWPGEKTWPEGWDTPTRSPD